MKQFFKQVDLRSRQAMIDFLENHFRYNTMNSWNRSTSYANNVKIYNLGLPDVIANKAYEIMDTDELWFEINNEIREWNNTHQHRWQAGFNGRSGGYLVLYNGGSKKSKYKSYCTRCGQRNFKTVEETKGNSCGRCGQLSRIDYKEGHEPKEIFTYPGKGVDMEEDFNDWPMYELRERVKLVQSFDRLCDRLLDILVNFCVNCEVEEEEVLVPTKRKTLQCVS